MSLFGGVQGYWPQCPDPAVQTAFRRYVVFPAAGKHPNDTETGAICARLRRLFLECYTELCTNLVLGPPAPRRVSRRPARAGPTELRRLHDRRDVARRSAHLAGIAGPSRHPSRAPASAHDRTASQTPGQRQKAPQRPSATRAPCEPAPARHGARHLLSCRRTSARDTSRASNPSGQR